MLENDLVDMCQAGDDVTVTGYIVTRWPQLVVGGRCDVDTVFYANHLRINNAQRTKRSMYC